jgi:hypothetical protein
MTQVLFWGCTFSEHAFSGHASSGCALDAIGLSFTSLVGNGEQLPPPPA